MIIKVIYTYQYYAVYISDAKDQGSVIVLDKET